MGTVTSQEGGYIRGSRAQRTLSNPSSGSANGSPSTLSHKQAVVAMAAVRVMVAVVLTVMVMMVMLMRCGEAVPSKVGNRMVPSWWINARSKRSCQRWSDCDEGECCARPMLATKAYCFPYKTLGDSCAASALLVNMENEVFLDHCPCDLHLTCANLYLASGGRASKSVCVDPDVAFDQSNTAEAEELSRPPPFPKQVTL